MAFEQKRFSEGREPWSSGYESGLMAEGHRFESQHRVLDGPFSQDFVVVKIVMFI